MITPIDFINEWDLMQVEVHKIATGKGWWSGLENASAGMIVNEKILLIITELAEAVEALRAGNPPDKHLPDFKSFDVELADVVIRIMDLAQAQHLRLSAAIVAKVQYNTTRPWKHGKQF